MEELRQWAESEKEWKTYKKYETAHNLAFPAYLLIGLTAFIIMSAIAWPENITSNINYIINLGAISLFTINIGDAINMIRGKTKRSLIRVSMILFSFIEIYFRQKEPYPMIYSIALTFIIGLGAIIYLYIAPKLEERTNKRKRKVRSF